MVVSTDKFEKNTLLGRIFVWLSRSKWVPNVVKRLFFMLWNCHIGCPLPKTVIFPHPFGIVIHGKVILGENVTILHQVTLGGKGLGKDGVPVIGDGVFIEAGANVLGKVVVGKDVVIGANAVVTKGVPDKAIVVGANRIIGYR